MKAKVWKDRDTGRWGYVVNGPSPSGGYEASWRAALSAALSDMRRRRVRQSLLHDIELLSMQARRRP